MYCQRISALLFVRKPPEPASGSPSSATRSRNRKSSSEVDLSCSSRKEFIGRAVKSYEFRRDVTILCDYQRPSFSLAGKSTRPLKTRPCLTGSMSVDNDPSTNSPRPRVLSLPTGESHYLAQVRSGGCLLNVWRLTSILSLACRTYVEM